MPLDDLVQVIETIQQRITSYGYSFNETQTRAALIDPLLTSLGWDVSDPGIVTPEYRTDVGWADYALRDPGNKPAAVVEAKKLGTFVENHLQQAVNYCIEQGIVYAGVTDGNHWQLYRTFEPVPLEQKRVLDVVVNSSPAHECALRFLMLWRPNLATGKAIPAETPIFGGGKDSPPPPPGDWKPLAELQSVTGTTAPTTIKFPGGEERVVARWWRVLAEVAEWLVGIGSLTASQVPIRIGNRQSYIVHSEGVHSNGNGFYRSHKLSNGFFCEVGISANDAVANARYLLNHFNQDPASVLLKFD